MFADNDYYGHRFILSKYCKVKNKNCFATIQHGILTPPQEKNLGKRKFIFSPFLCWNKRVFKKAKLKKIPGVIPIGSPFIYLNKILENTEKKTKGTIVFPSKSSSSFDRNIDNEALIYETEKRFAGPYSICVYYLDLNKDWSKFKKRGWRVFSCGNKESKNFLFILHKNLSKHKNVVCTSINTATFYSMYLKKNFKLIINSTNKRKNKSLVNLSLKDQYIQRSTRSYYEKKYPGFCSNSLSIEKRYEIAKKELGHEFLMEKEDLIKLLGWDNRIKIILSRLLNFYFRHRIV